MEGAGDFVDGRGAPPLLREPLPTVGYPKSQFPQTATDSDRVLFPQIAADFPHDDGNRVRGETDGSVYIEPFHRLDESKASHLEQIVRVHAGARAQSI